MRSIRCAMAGANLLVALSFAGCGAFESSTGTSTSNKSTAAPTAVQLSPIVAQFETGDVTDCRVVLHWQSPASDANVTAYHVFRGENDQFPCTDAREIGRVLPTDLEFVDSKPPKNSTAWYAIVAINQQGTKGPAAYLAVQVPDNQPPVNRLELDVIFSPKGPFLRWWGARDTDVAAIEILRGEGGSGSLEKIADIDDPKSGTYCDRNAAHDKTYRYAVQLRDTDGLTSAPTASTVAEPGLYVRRINCGGKAFTGADGIPWEPDYGYSRNTGFEIKPTRVSGAHDLEPIYHSERWAHTALTYHFRVKPGLYQIVLHFAETNPVMSYPGKRTFDVYVDGQRRFEDVDIFAQAGANAAVRLATEVDIAQPEFEIRLAKGTNGPAIKGIEVRELPARVGGHE